MNYSYNAYYSLYSPPHVPGLSKHNISPAAVQCGQTSQNIAVDFAKRTIRDGYGVYMIYNLDNRDWSSLLSALSHVLYNSEVTVGTLYPKDY